MRVALPIVMAIVLLGSFAITREPELVISVATDSDVIIRQRVTVSTPITIVFTHSMYGGDVRESWHLATNAHLVRDRIVTDNQAAAEYYATDGRVERASDGFRVITPPLTIDRLTVRVDGIGRHRLIIGSHTYPLFDALQRSVRVTITGSRTSAWSAPGDAHATIREMNACRVTRETRR